MKKFIIAAAVAFTLSVPAFAADSAIKDLLESPRGFHASVKVSSFDVSFADDSGVMVVGAIGKAAPVKNTDGRIGLEVELGKSVASAEYEYSNRLYGYKVEADHMVLGGYATYDHAMTDTFFLGGRLGFAYADIDTTVSSYSGGARFSNADDGTSVNFAYGIQAGVIVTPMIVVLVGYTSYDVVDRIEAGIQYTF